MLTDKEKQDIYQLGFREGFGEALDYFDNFLRRMKQRENGTTTITSTTDWIYENPKD